MNGLEYLLLLVAAFLGGGLALLWKEQRKEWLGVILAFAGSYILGIIATHLLPGIFGEGHARGPGLALLAGFVVQLLFSLLSQGVEHGHIHREKATGSSFLVIYGGLCLHAFVEGLPLSGYEALDAHAVGHGHDHHPLFNHLLAGVALHKLPEAYVMALLVRINQPLPSRFWVFMVIFASMSPLGALTGYYLLPDAQMVRLMLAFVVGSLMHISTTILFESESKGHHAIPWRKMAAMGLGILFALLAA